MKSSTEWMEKTKSDYLRAKQLTDIESESDPMCEPYKSKYEAKQIIERLGQQLNESHISDNSRVELIRALFDYELGSIDVDTEELSEGEKRLQSCLSLLNETFADRQQLMAALTLFFVVVNNQLGYVWCLRSDFERALAYLKDAENYYNKWNSSESQKKRIFDFLDAFSSEPLSETIDAENTANAIKNLEKAYTMTLYFLAQTYENIGDSNNAAIYCHSTLKRQYKYLETKEQMCDLIEWSLNAATLSQFFAINDDFNAARHHLFCAKKVILTYNNKEEEKYVKGLADLNRIFVKYSLMLLESSGIALKDESIAPQIVEYTFRPYLLNDAEVESLEKELPTFPVISFDDAKQLFKNAINCLNEAKDYYTLDEHASDYIACIQDQSKLYQYMIPFENDHENQCKMLKRRIDLLENLLKNINPQYFMAHYRQILFELGEIYSQMIELKNILMKNKSKNEQISAAKKINALIQKGVTHLSGFIETFYEKKTKSLPKTLEDDYVRPFLLAYFSIGRLLSKTISSDPRDQLKNWSECESYYTRIRDYLDLNPQHKDLFKEELPLVEEMLVLIPGKMQMIANS